MLALQQQHLRLNDRQVQGKARCVARQQVDSMQSPQTTQNEALIPMRGDEEWKKEGAPQTGAAGKFEYLPVLGDGNSVKLETVEALCVMLGLAMSQQQSQPCGDG